METLQQRVASKFLASLTEHNALDQNKIDELRQLIGHGKKPKADDFIKIFTTPAGGDVK